MGTTIRRTKNNFIFSVISQIVTVGLGLLIPRIVMVGYGSEVNGLLNSVTQFVAYLIIFEAGIQAVATQSLYKTVGADDKKSTNAILSAVDKNYKKIGVLYLCGLLGLSLVYPFFCVSENISYLTIFWVTLFSGLGNVISFFFQGKYKILLLVEGKNYILTNLTTIITVLNNVTKVLLLYLGCNVSIVIFATFLISLIQTIYIIAYIKRKYKWINLSETPNFVALKQSKSALIHQISGLIFYNTDVLILTIVCGLETVSVYTVYKLLCDHIFSFLRIPFDSCSFALGQTYSLDRKKYSERIDAIEILCATLFFSVFTVVLKLILPFMRLYTSGVGDISYVDRYLAVLFVGYELLNWMRVPMIKTIDFAGHFKETLPQTIIESSINIFVSLICVFFWGIYGVLMGTIAALLYRSVDIIIYANKKILCRKPCKTFFIYVLNCSIMLVVSIVLNQFDFSIVNYWDFFKFGTIVTPIVLVVFASANAAVFRNDIRIFIRK